MNLRGLFGMDITNVTDVIDTSNMSDTEKAKKTNVMDMSSKEESSIDTVTVSRILGVQESTVRKYCALMIKNGYEFDKNSVGHRVFYKKDVEVMKNIVDLKNSGSLTLAEAVQTILNSNDIPDTTTDIVPVTDTGYDKILKQFQEFKDEQMEFNKQLLKELKRKDDYIKNSILERDRKLIAALRESMETRKQIAELSAKLEKNRKSWWQFWK